MAPHLHKGKEKRAGEQGHVRRKRREEMHRGTGAREGEPCGLFVKRVAEVAEVTEGAEDKA